jgi:trigger factor
MTETVREVSRFERLLTVELTDAEIDSAKAGAARRLAKDLKIPGFRPGKAPRPVVEAAIGSGRLRTEAIEDLIPKKLGEILTETNLAPAVTPTLEKVDDIEGGVNAEVRVTLWPELDAAPDYKDRAVEVDAPELSETDLKASLDRMRQQFASLETVERPAGEGDFVSIDISAFADGVVVEEANATELLYEVGSGIMIDGIDDQLRGKSAGEEASFDGPLPEGFGERAGATVGYQVKVNEVKARVLPDLDDEWVNEVTEFETVEELRSELADRLALTKRRAVLSQFRQKALDLLVDEAEIDLPEGLVTTEMDELFHRFSHRLEENEITMADYFEATGIDQDAFIEDLRQQAVRSIRTRLVLEAVAKAEDIKVSSEEVAATIEALARSSENAKEVYDAFTNSPRALVLAGDILRNKAVEAVIAAARAVDIEGNPVDLSIDEEPLDSPENGQEVSAVEAEIVDPGSGDYQSSERQVTEGLVQEGQVVPEGQIFEAEIVDEEN